MGNQKLKWTAEEEEALKSGVAKHGVGKWKHILVDSEFAHKLAHRSNVDLKDKWRNMGANHGQGSRGYAVMPKGKATAVGVVPLKSQNSSSGVVSKGNVNDRPSQKPQDVKSGPKYNTLILEAISSIKDQNGSDFGAIMGFIEKKYEVPQRFRRLLSSKLTKLVSQGTLEKVQKRYKIKLAALGTKTPTPKQKNVRSKPAQEPRLTDSAEALEEAAEIAAYKIAEAENKSFVAAEAAKESERVSQMAEEADAVLMHLEEVFEKWSALIIIPNFTVV